jgi:autotransporter-associated beta strand protein
VGGVSGEKTYAGVGKFDGTISGEGSLVKDGDGNLTLTGTNNLKYLVKRGNGDLTLTGDNTYTDTTVSAGTLRIGNGGTTGRIAGNITNQSIVEFNHSDGVEVEYGGDISGSGRLVKNGGGTLILTGNNTYTDEDTYKGITVSAGKLQIGNGGTTGSLKGDIENQSIVEFNRSGEVEYDGVISGSGRLVKEGAGTLILTNDNTYKGTTVSDGTLQIGNGGTTGSIQGDIDNQSIVEFNRSDVAEVIYDGVTYNGVIYDGVISGSGRLDKAGSGTLILTKDNTYTGETFIKAGTLDLVGSLQSEKVTVEDSATFTLRGTPGETTGGRTGGHVTLLGNSTLNAYQGGLIGGDLEAIQGGTLNFYLPSDIPDEKILLTAKATLLTVNGNADITDSLVTLAPVDGGAASLATLQKTQSIYLLEALGEDGLKKELKGLSSNSTATLQIGASFLANFSLSTDLTHLIATWDADAFQLQPQTKAFAEGFLSGLAFLNRGQDLIIDKGIDAALGAQRPLTNDETARPQPFVAMSSGHLRHHTGSHVDIDGYSLMAGFAGTGNTATGTLTAGTFLEHGEGDYDSYNSFATAASVHGKGDTDYTGVGLLAHFAFNETPVGNLYVETSVRAGKVATDFRSNNIQDGFGRRATYEAKSRYYGTHLGVGYLLHLNEQNQLNLYGHYLWSHQNSDNAKLSTGETIKFQSVDSKRTRLGAKWQYQLNPQTTTYLGAAWEHEHDGKAKASIYGHQLDAPKLKGNTGIAEIGLTLNPNPNATKQMWSLDMGVQAYTGKREGVMGSVKVNYKF